MKDLRIYIEQVVRPIRATWKRKLRMREELLSHLSALHREESKKGDSPDRALERALERFGPPEELRSDLEASLPPRARAAYSAIVKPRWTSPWVGVGKMRDSENPASHALRIGLIHGALSALLYVVVGLALNALTLPVLWAHPILSPCAFGLASGASLFLLLMVMPALLDKTFTETSSVRRGLFKIAGFLFMLAAMGAVLFSALLGINGELPTETQRCLAGALTGMTGFLAPLFGYQFYSREHEEWEALDLS